MKNSKRTGKRKRKSAKGSAVRPSGFRPDWVADAPWEPKEPLPVPSFAVKMKHRRKVGQAISTFLQLEELGLEARVMPDGTAFGIYDGDHRIGSVSDSRAIVGKHSRPSNFTNESAPWAGVQGYLAEQVEESAPAPRADLPMIVFADARPIEVWPESATATVVSLGVDASGRLRAERVHDHNRSVTLRTAEASLSIDPIASGGLLPFQYTNAHGQSVRGALKLRSDGETIPVLVEGRVEDRLLATAWLAALSGFADLTCRPRLGDARTRRMWSALRLIPRSASAEHMAAAVSGHARRLPEGHNPGEEARERAVSIGVQLRERETWVRPHPRGGEAPVGDILFDWDPAAAVAQQLSALTDRGDNVEQRAA